jgi:membrane protein required for colicin V production
VSLTALDLVVIAVVALSALLSLSRGMARETLTLAAWVGAFAAAWFGYAEVRPLVRDVIANELLADLATAALVFLVPFIALRILGGMIGRGIQNSAFGPLDRLLGLGFGLVRGAVIVSLAWLLAGILVPPEREPDWMRHAYLRPQLAQGAALIRTVLPADFDDRTRQTTGGTLERVGTLRALEAPDPPGYGQGERRQLQDLIRRSTGGS